MTADAKDGPSEIGAFKDRQHCIGRRAGLIAWQHSGRPFRLRLRQPVCLARIYFAAIQSPCGLALLKPVIFSAAPSA